VGRVEVLGGAAPGDVSSDEGADPAIGVAEGDEDPVAVDVDEVAAAGRGSGEAGVDELVGGEAFPA